VAGITDYAAANTYLTTTFLPDFNRHFTVNPAQPESPFVRLAGVDLRPFSRASMSASYGTTAP
jgi:hypothetical protein